MSTVVGIMEMVVVVVCEGENRLLPFQSRESGMGITQYLPRVGSDDVQLASW